MLDDRDNLYRAWIYDLLDDLLDDVFRIDSVNDFVNSLSEAEFDSVCFGLPIPIPDTEGFSIV